MKRCPECRRDYYDETLLYCLEDGVALLQGPVSPDEPATAILQSTAAPGEAATRAQIQTTEAEPPGYLADTSERQSLSAHRAAKPLAGASVVLVLIVGGFFGYRYFNAGGNAINSIAVLPFQNRSGNADTDYLSDGLAESLIYRLTQLPGLKVSPTNSVLRYKGSQADIADIARELEVDAVMSGRLTQRGEDLSISVELTDARTKKLIWAEQYSRKMSDLLATQREIATTVTQKLQLKLSGDQTKGLTKQYTTDNEAYQLYLKGRFYWNKRTPEGLETAIAQFKAASDEDPNFALAYVGIADSHLVGLYSTRGKEKEAISTAKAYATRALEIDPSLAEAYASLGLVNTYSWNWAEGENYYKRAIELNPNYPTTHHWYSRLLRTQGRGAEALDQITQARNADELSPVISNNLAEALFEQGDIAGAIDEARRCIGLAPVWTGYRVLVYGHLRSGRNEEALADAKRTVELVNGAATLKLLGYVHAVIGNRDDAIAIARQLETSFGKGEADGRDVAVVYAGLGENDKVFEWLEKDFQSRNTSLLELRMEVPFVPLRSDPRFKDLLKRMGLPE